MFIYLWLENSFKLNYKNNSLFKIYNKNTKIDVTQEFHYCQNTR